MLSIVGLLRGAPQFLTGQNMMDYSLLLGIHDSRQADSPSSPSHGGGDPFSDSDGYEEEEEEELGEGPGGARFGSPPGGAHARALPRLASIDQGKGPMEINPSVDVYAIKSSHRKFLRISLCFFLIFRHLFA